MDDEVDRVAASVEFGGDRIDQERHVVVDDLNDGMRRLPTILAQRRVMDADFCGGRRPFVSEAEHREGAAVQYFGTDTEDVARRDVGIEAADELLCQRRRVGFYVAEIGIESGRERGW